jgi:hypothetical protein
MLISILVFDQFPFYISFAQTVQQIIPKALISVPFVIRFYLQDNSFKDQIPEKN